MAVRAGRATDTNPLTVGIKLEDAFNCTVQSNNFKGSGGFDVRDFTGDATNTYTSNRFKTEDYTID